MKKLLIFFLAFLLCLPNTYAGIFKKKNDKRLAALTTIVDGDTIPSFQLMEVNIYGRRDFSNKRKKKKYDKLVRDVLKTYPYSKEIKAVMVETYLYLQTLPNEEDQRKHLDKVEKGVWEQYLPIMKKMTLSQGKMLIKLIDRECNQTSYELIDAFIGRFKARFYQTFAALFGASLKKEYDPTGDDADIEEIIYLYENDLLELVN